jgi:predicted kinase
MRTIYIMSGLPHAGKTFYIKQHAQDEDIILNHDDFYAANRGQMAWATYINEYLTDTDKNIWVDQRILDTHGLQQLIVNLVHVEANIEVIVVDTRWKTILERNAACETEVQLPIPTLETMRTKQRQRFIETGSFDAAWLWPKGIITITHIR